MELQATWSLSATVVAVAGMESLELFRLQLSPSDNYELHGSNVNVVNKINILKTIGHHPTNKC